MKAVTWQGKRKVSVETVPDPVIEQPTDAIIKITSTNICGSDLHLYEVLGPFMDAGDVLGHEPMGIVEEVGSEAGNLKVGRPGGDPVPDLLRALLDVRADALHPVRDDPGPGAGLRRRPLRLLQALRPGARRAGRVPARPPGAVHPHQGARGPGGRPLRLPLRRAADGLAGRDLRRHPAGGLGGRARPRSDRRHGLPDRQAQQPRAAGHRRRPGPRAAGPGAGPRHRGHRPERARDGPGRGRPGA